MGTRYTVKYIGSRLNETREQVQKRIGHLLVDINQEMSTYIPDSEISQLNNNQSVDWIKLSPRLFTVLVAAKTTRISTEQHLPTQNNDNGGSGQFW